MSDESGQSAPKAVQRPLSPHLTNYSLPLLPITSILGRVTGVGNSIGLVIVTWWLIALATGPGAYATFAAVIGNPLGMLALFGFTVSFFYHFCKGIRQFIWDTGRGMDVETAERMSLIVFGAAGVLSIFTWILILLA